MEQTVSTSAWTNVSEIELVYKSKVKASERPQITSSRDAYNILLKVWDDNILDLIEQCKVLLLNRSHKVLGVVDISTGGITGVVVDPRIILGAALKSGAVGIILSHSHPSGCISPSRDDKQLTERLKSAAQLMEITLLDHIIVTRDGYYSFADEGLI